MARSFAAIALALLSASIHLPGISAHTFILCNNCPLTFSPLMIIRVFPQSFDSPECRFGFLPETPSVARGQCATIQDVDHIGGFHTWVAFARRRDQGIVRWTGDAPIDCFGSSFNGIRERSGADQTRITLFCPGGRPIGVSEPVPRHGNDTTFDNLPVVQFDELNSTELLHVFEAAFEEPDEAENGSGRNLLRP
ncbi:unnamed protein product [Vitrella brassicaformis CCMP3155]|uniref:Uncharacterized protein n=1 Tax=Vitrella brassicaformis (strain CCMP3155) TaxID=1169540 RepID=A0A0G4GPC6_VITBC|nr:unnamed protein product [Vitrella brassicaformis CCMP3155]|eukprot:CEM32027.1 unnamed protein product [Vitrella brassicaformis CCMP3155]